MKRQIEDKKQTLESIPENLPLMWADRIRVGRVLPICSAMPINTSENGLLQVGVEGLKTIGMRMARRRFCGEG